MKYYILWIDAKCSSSFVLNDSIVILLTICVGRKFQIFTILLKKVLRFIRSKTLTNDLVTSGACEIGSYIVVYINIIKDMEILNTSIKSPRSLRLDKLNKFSSLSRSS